MISIRCPHCHVGLKVDETKIPSGITSFKCPKCKGSIPVALLSVEESGEKPTELVSSVTTNTGRITVLPNPDTKEQVFPLYEGTYIIGRKSASSKANIAIETMDRSMSREHIRIEVKKDASGRYKHFLSDNNSKNHTLYNNNILETGEVMVLNDKDEIVLGHTILRFTH